MDVQCKLQINNENTEHLHYQVTFPNGLFSLKPNSKFIQTNVNMGHLQMGIQFEERDEKKIEYLKENLINKLFPNEEERKLHLLYDSTILGGCKPKQIMFNYGIGNNGKSTWSNILCQIMGTYAVRFIPASNDALYRFFGADQAKQLAGKRFIVIEGINDPFKIERILIKQMTSSPLVKVRRMFRYLKSLFLPYTLHFNSNSSKCIQPGYKMGDCYLDDCDAFHISDSSVTNYSNEAIAIASKCYPPKYHLGQCNSDDLVLSRIIVFQYRSKFTNKINEVNETSNIYLANPEFGNKKFVKEYGIHIFHILVEYFQEYMQNCH